MSWRLSNEQAHKTTINQTLTYQRLPVPQLYFCRIVFLLAVTKKIAAGGERFIAVFAKIATFRRNFLCDHWEFDETTYTECRIDSFNYNLATRVLLIC